MTVGLFVDKNHSPTEDELKTALGPAWQHWQQLVSFMVEKYALQVELTFGGKNYGWNLWYRKGGKSLASLYPQQDWLVAQVVLGKEQVEKALGLDLGENVGKVLSETPQFHDGRWLFIPVKTERDVQDVEQLLLVKKNPVKKTGKI
jgi:hypothetical protein